MRNPFILDTNVLITANGGADHASMACVNASVDQLIEIKENGRVLIDETGFILDEYSRHMSHRGQPGTGDAFFKWLWENQGHIDLCTRINIHPRDENGTSFPAFPEDDINLSSFDLSDRKFVAVAIASGEFPPIINATDTDWWNFQEALADHSVTICFICPELMND